MHPAPRRMLARAVAATLLAVWSVLTLPHAVAHAASLPVLDAPAALAPLGPPATLPDVGVSARVPAPPEHAVHVLSAEPEQPALVVSPPGFSYESNVANRKLGLDLTPVGDVNGDGINDFVALGDVNSFNTALYVFLGSAGGPVLAAGYPVTNLPADALVGPTGDVNGDGRDDLMLFWIGSGNARVYYGATGGLDMVGYTTIGGSHFGINSLNMNVAPAGDVNGDGYGDVVVGMPNRSGGAPCGASSNNGVVEVLYGSATGLSASSFWLCFGCLATNNGSFLGYSVGGAGDVNADGYDDIVMGAPGAELYLYGVVGKTYVMYGSASGMPVINGFSNLGSPNQGTTIAGQHLYMSFGQSVAPAGDLNGDGYADIAVGAPTDDTYGNDAGLAYVFRGTSAGIDTTVANVLWWESAGLPGAQFGRTVAPAGDVNGDGRPDLLVSETSRVDLAQSAGSTLIIEQTLGFAANSSHVRTAGDVNGDGLSDLVVGDWQYGNGESFEGRVLVYYGTGSPPSSYTNWSATQIVIDNPNLGWSVAGGDVNGDGYDDVILGAPTWYNWSVGGESNNGLVMIFYGHATGLSTFYDWAVWGASGDQLGITVASGDVNGDGYADVLAGAHTSAGGLGQVRIWYGSSAGPAFSPVTITGAGGYFGSALACAGDVNGDGYPDVVVGAPEATDPTTPLAGEGRAYLYLGGAGGLGASPVWSRSGGQANAHLGQVVAAAGDVNGNAYGDFLVGMPDWDGVDKFSNPVPDQGRVYVEYGGSGGVASEQTSGVFTAWRWGASVAGAGDVNGDGYSDIIVGGTSATYSLPGEGVARVLAGGPAGLNGVLWTQYGGEAYGGFGSSVSSAGDVDGDGLSDVLVGAVFQDMSGPQDQGRAYVYRGPLPDAAPPYWTASGGSAFANLGHSLANAGDVNGDGWSDLVFGEPGYSDQMWRQGICQVRYGARATGSFQLGLAYHGTAPTHLVQPGCLTDAGTMLLLSTGRSAAGRAKVRLNYRLTPAVRLSVPVVSGFTAWSPTGTPGAFGSLAGIVTGVGALMNGVPYAWQVRTQARNVWFPTGPWRSPARSGRLETDVRVPGTWVGVSPQTPLATLQLADVQPNPMLADASIAFTLTKSGRVTLEVLDVQGRRVRALVQGTLTAGPHRVAWDGRTDDGAAASAGIYLVRMEAEGRTLSRKLARLR